MVFLDKQQPICFETMCLPCWIGQKHYSFQFCIKNNHPSLLKSAFVFTCCMVSLQTTSDSICLKLDVSVVTTAALSSSFQTVSDTFWYRLDRAVCQSYDKTIRCGQSKTKVLVLHYSSTNCTNFKDAGQIVFSKKKKSTDSPGFLYYRISVVKVVHVTK